MSSTPKRSKRTSAACDFCRRRKLGCDNARPRCTNCVAHQMQCIYTKRVKHERPSNARIRQLETENSRLRESLSQDAPSLRQNTSPVNYEYPHPSSCNEQTPTTRLGNPENAQLPSPSTSNLGTPRSIPRRPEQGHLFLGPSGIDLSSGRPAEAEASAEPETNVADGPARNQLVGHTARQRQLETLNLAQEKLDFRGVDPEEGMDLLASFWNRQHYTGSVVYRPVFMRDMATNGRYFSELLLHALLFSGSKHSVRTGERNLAGREHRQRFEEVLHANNSELLFKSDITTIQALLIVADALFSWCDEISLSWQYMGLAINMIMDIGLHAEKPMIRVGKGYTVEDLEVHRRVFWAAFVFDKVQSIYQGRPVRLRASDNHVPIRFLDDYEELEPFYTGTYSPTPIQLRHPTRSVSTFEQLCKLSILIDRVLCNLYAEGSPTKSAQDLLDTCNSIHADLERWRNDLPQYLVVKLDNPSPSSILPHTLALLAMYNAMVILLHRPFVSDGHLQSVSDSAAREAFSLCASAAVETHRLLQLYKKHYCPETMPYSISYATYVSATIHIRMAAQADHGSAAHSRLRNCVEILCGQQQTCQAPARALKILLGLAARLEVDIGEISVVDAPSGAAYATSCKPSQRILLSDTDGQGGADGGLNNVSPDCSLDLGGFMMDFDMDEVMRSFDFTQNSMDPTIGKGFDGGVPESAPGLMQSANGVSQDPDGLFYPDFLFGFDSVAG